MGAMKNRPYLSNDYQSNNHLVLFKIILSRKWTRIIRPRREKGEQTQI